MIDTDRLLLRLPRPADVDPLLDVFGDPEVMRQVAWGRPFTRAETERLVERMIERFEIDGFGQWVVERLAKRLGGKRERRIVTSFGKSAGLYGYELTPPENR